MSRQKMPGVVSQVREEIIGRPDSQIVHFQCVLASPNGLLLTQLLTPLR